MQRKSSKHFSIGDTLQLLAVFYNDEDKATHEYYKVQIVDWTRVLNKDIYTINHLNGRHRGQKCELTASELNNNVV